MTDMTAEKPLRSTILEILASTRGESEGHTADAILSALTAPRVPDIGGHVMNECAWSFIEAMPDGADRGNALTSTWLKPSLHAAITTLLTAATAPTEHVARVGTMEVTMDDECRVSRAVLRDAADVLRDYTDKPREAAPAPADPFTHSAELHASRRNGLPTPVHDDDDGRVLQVNSAMPLFTTMEGAELAALREYVIKHREAAGIDAVEMAELRERYDDLLAKHQEVLDTVQQCACAYDGPKDVCVGHAKEMATLRERVKELEALIADHNAEMDSMCADKSRCGYAAYKRNCPNCPTDYKIEAASLRGGSDE